jgi:peptide chain release factor 1
MGYHEIAFEITGKGLEALTAEAGGHRIQRIPETERGGRVHTSTVTLAILGDNIQADPLYLKREPLDFKLEWFSGTGAGGQKRNKCQNSCRITHIPTGITRAAQTRSRQSSERDAMAELLGHLDTLSGQEHHGRVSSDRKDQLGSGMRGDKIRTIRFQDDSAVDHRTGKRISAEKYMKGQMDSLWPNA